jgi:galactokinase
VRGRAPGRLDLLGGVADYAGALVLEVPTHQAVEVVVTPADALVVGPVTLARREVEALAREPFDAIRTAVAAWPRWTRYVIGVALVLLRHELIEVPVGRVEIRSDLPASVGVASSAALEVATARALGAGGADPVWLATLCQRAENRVVGAPCGVMDQVAVIAGVPGEILPILCRPASVAPSVAVPDHLEVVAWSTGAAHDVGGLPYGRARAAAFMGKRMVEHAAESTWAYGSQLPDALVATLPEVVEGAAFLERFGDHGDPVTAVHPATAYPVRSATAFGVEEHRRCVDALARLGRDDGGGVGELMAASHAGYDAMGLGHPSTTAVVAEALSRPGVLGARVSAGGDGGSVVVLCRRGALDDVDTLIR